MKVWQNPWRLMLAVNLAVVIGVFLHKIALPPYVPYIHLLVDYHFGFIKRALIGAVVSLFTAKVPVWLVFALAGATWLVTLGLFVKLFRRTFGFEEKHLPLFVLIAGSPFFFKNFMHTLGHFDIYGCLFAIVLLLVPARSILFVLLAAVFSIVLILIHHIHLLMYVPTIVAIVVVRHYLVEGITRANIAVGAASVLALGALFFAAQFWGTMPIPEAEFVKYLQSRMADPSQTSLLSFSYIWYQPLSKEISDTWAWMPHNILGRACVRAFDLAAYAGVAHLRRVNPRAEQRLASPHRHRGADRRQPRLSHHVRHRVRLFTLGVELGGVHVPAAACGENVARRGGAAARRRRSQDAGFRLDRDADSARRHCPAFLARMILAENRFPLFRDHALIIAPA